MAFPFTKDRGRQEPIVANVLIDAAANQLVVAGAAAAETGIIDLPPNAVILEASLRVEQVGTGVQASGTAVAMSAFTGDLKVGTGGASLLAAAFDLRSAVGVGVKTVASLPAKLSAKTAVTFTPSVGGGTVGLATATGKFRVTVKYAIDGRADEVQP